MASRRDVSGRRQIAVAAALLVAVAIRVGYVHSGGVAVDEFQHLHAAYLVSRGERPYADFFEHHTPLFYLLGGAAMPRDPTFDTIVHFRFAALAAHLTTVVIGSLWAGSVAGAGAAALTAALLLGNFFSFAFGTLAYLDSFAAPLLLGAAALLAAGAGRPLRLCVAGALLAAAMLTTQKLGIAIAAVLIVFLGRSPLAVDRPWRSWLTEVGAFALGGSVVTAAVLWRLGGEAAAGLVRDAFILNLHWKARHPPLKEIGLLGASDGFLYLVALHATAITGWNLVRRRFVVHPEDVPALFVAAFGVGAVVLPVVWSEYFIVPVTFATVVAALSIHRHWRDGTWARMSPLRSAWALPFAALLLAGVTARCGVTTFLPRAQGFPAWAAAASFALSASLALAGARTYQHRAATSAPLWVALLLAYPLVQQVEWAASSSNASQRRAVDYVLATTTPTETVFDGYSGYGVFRPHAYRYWFLHDEVQLMLSERERTESIIAALEDRRPPLAIVDQWTRLLPQPVLDYIGSHYENTPLLDIKRRTSQPNAHLGVTHREGEFV